MKKIVVTYFEDDGTLLGKTIEHKIADFANQNNLSPSDFKICHIGTRQEKKDNTDILIREVSVLYYADEELARKVSAQYYTEREFKELYGG
ncbi:MAG: hypothetical protein NTY31_01445 [Candidatus Falkowbacteria bacterium]|nr:hypothetical protein [Candidatus Falkowbacteria bacterium]